MVAVVLVVAVAVVAVKVLVVVVVMVVMVMVEDVVVVIVNVCTLSTLNFSDESEFNVAVLSASVLMLRDASVSDPVVPLVSVLVEVVVVMVVVLVVVLVVRVHIVVVVIVNGCTLSTLNFSDELELNLAVLSASALMLRDASALDRAVS